MTSPLSDEVLCRLIQAAGAPVSGQGLARALGVTRAAVWKCVDTLRCEGYPIESLQARGYRLGNADHTLRPGEIAARLTTRRLGAPVRYFDEVASTNQTLEEWALAGAPEGALVVAEHQTTGRGRLRRAWFDRPRESLLLSLLLRPTLPAAAAPTITYAAAVALAETLAARVARERIEIKWPNDVLVDGRKIAGILLEMRCEAQYVEHVILGVGVNVLGSSATFPAELRGSGTTLQEACGAEPSRVEALCALLEAFERVYDRLQQDGFTAIQELWNGWFRAAGSALRIRTPGGVVEGTARGLGPGGALVLECPEGGSRLVHAGDVEACRAAAS